MKRFLFSTVFLLLSVQNALADDTPRLSELKWGEARLPDLPGKIGFGGPIAGTHNGVLIVAGGANFPKAPPWSVDGKPKGNKVWYDHIFVLEQASDAQAELKWQTGFKLPRPLAYAPAVSIPAGMVILGGETYGELIDSQTKNSKQGNFAISEVLLLSWNKNKKKITVDRASFPPLPKASSYHSAAVIDNIIYVVASHAQDKTSDRLDCKSFWSLDFSKPVKERKWIDLKPWPGKPRHKMAVAVQNAGADKQYVTPKCFYLFSGSTWVNGNDGEPDLSKFEFFTDAYRYNPKSKQWKRIADLPVVKESRKLDLKGYQYDKTKILWSKIGEGKSHSENDLDQIFKDQPRAAAASCAINLGQSHILLFSGATGRMLTIDIQDRANFPAEVLAYHTITDTWTIAGKMPQGVVTTNAVWWNDQIVIPSGEIRPGVRTPKVQSLQIQQNASGFGTINFIVLSVYLTALVLMGLYFFKREKGTDDFFLAGGRIPWWAAGLSIYATQLSAITFITLPALPYATNWLIYPGQITMFLMAPIVVFFYLPFFRRLKVTTAYEYLECRFDVKVRLFGSISFIVFQFARMAIVVYVPALVLTVVTGMNIYVCIIVMGTLSTLYTVLGGMEAVIWTDVIQVFVLWGGMLLAVILILIDVGGIGTVYQTAIADDKLQLFNWTWDTTQMATWLIFVGSFALQFAPYTTDQAVIQRYMTTSDEKAAARSIWLNGALTIPFSLLFFTLGVCLYVFFKNRPEMLALSMDNDNAFAFFVGYQIPVGLSGLVIAGVFAASMSSLDSSIHSVATSITVDFYRRFKPQASDHDCLKLARVLTVLIGIIGTSAAIALASYDIKSLFLFFQKLLGLISSGLVGVFILGMFTRRANASGVLIGAAASFAALAYVTFYTQTNFFMYAIIGISTSVIVGYVASMLILTPEKSLVGLTYHTSITDKSNESPRNHK